MAGQLTFRKMPTGAYPLVGLMGGVVLGVGFWFTHVAKHPELNWGKHKDGGVWNSVQPNQTFKLHDASGKFSKWVRNGSTTTSSTAPSS